MNILQLANMVQPLGLNVNYAALGSIIPLLSKKAVEIETADVRTVFDLFGLAGVDDTVAEETALAVRTSNFDQLSDLLGNQEYLLPIIRRVLFSQSRLIERLVRDEPYVPVMCNQCNRVNQVSRAEAAAMSADAVIQVRCVQCESTKTVSAASVATFGI